MILLACSFVLTQKNQKVKAFGIFLRRNNRKILNKMKLALVFLPCRFVQDYLAFLLVLNVPISSNTILFSTDFSSISPKMPKAVS